MVGNAVATIVPSSVLKIIPSWTPTKTTNAALLTFGRGPVVMPHRIATPEDRPIATGATDSGRFLATVPPVFARPVLGYQPALDGVRALAVLAVIAHHAKLGGVVGGGVVGVETFFVLSGFLITTLLLEERWRDTRISILRFYARRAFRLFPALGAVVIVIVVYAAIRGEATTLGATPFVVGYSANWAQAGGRNLGLFTHTWSLAIEEQFYVIWPLVVALLLRCARPLAALGGVALGLGAVSTVARIAIWLDTRSVVRVRGGFDTRAAGLLFGAAVAVARFAASPRRRAQIAHIVPRFATAAAAVLAVICTTAINVDRWGYTWGLTVVQISALVIIVTAVTAPGSWPSRVLSARPLPAIGRISYGLYLWHFPVFLVVRHRIHMSQPMATLVGLGASFALAYASFVLVEQPARRWGTRISGRGVTPAAAPSPRR